MFELDLFVPPPPPSNGTQALAWAVVGIAVGVAITKLCENNRGVTVEQRWQSSPGGDD